MVVGKNIWGLKLPRDHLKTNKICEKAVKKGISIVWWRQEEVVEVTDSCFKIIWYAEIKNILIKEDVEIWSKRGYNQRRLWTKTNNWYIYDWCKQGGGIW